MYLRSKSAVELLALLQNVARYHIRRYMIMDLFDQRCFLTHALRALNQSHRVKNNLRHSPGRLCESMATPYVT